MEHFLVQKFHFFDVFLFVGHDDTHAEESVDFLEEDCVVCSEGSQEILEGLHGSLSDLLGKVVEVFLQDWKDDLDVWGETGSHGF